MSISVWVSMGLSVCLSVCLSVHMHNSKTMRPNATKFLVHVETCTRNLVAFSGRGSVFSDGVDTLCTSSFIDVVMFSYYGTYGQMDWHGIV